MNQDFQNLLYMKTDAAALESSCNNKIYLQRPIFQQQIRQLESLSAYV